MKNETAQTTVMVVDDTPANLRYLQEILRDKGNRVMAFPDGKAALNAVAKRPPDMIVLDILMPEMDGFEVCRRLKADPYLSKIPVLFISALGDVDHKTRAFEEGGVDYVTKPFEENEVLSRVETHLKLSRLTRDLEERVEERTSQLTQSNQALQEEIAVRKQAEQQLREQQAMLQSVLEGITEPLMLVDRDMQVKLFNTAASLYYQPLGFSLTPGEIPCYHCGRDDPKTSNACDLPKTVSQGQHLTVERKGIVDPERIEKVVLYPVEENGCKTGDVIIRISDVTEERKLAQEVAQADKLISLGTAATGVAHEINNPNHIIKLNANTLSDVWDAVVPVLDSYYAANGDFPVGALSYSTFKEEIPGLIVGIQSSADRIKRIVDVLKDFAAKQDKLILMPTDLNEAVKKTYLLLNHRIKKETGRFEVSYGVDLPAVKADCVKLEQVFVNLVSNALDALPDGNSGIFVQTWFEEHKKEVLFEVCDEGAGIPEQDFHRIMDPFFTTKRDSGGTGLGLAIAKQIVDLHGGRLEVESTERRGSTFRVALPALQLEETGAAS
jgi:signal transduction histidine kinase/CheY-like chemotaxis protein